MTAELSFEEEVLSRTEVKIVEAIQELQSVFSWGSEQEWDELIDRVHTILLAYDQDRDPITKSQERLTRSMNVISAVTGVSINEQWQRHVSVIRQAFENGGVI